MEDGVKNESVRTAINPIINNLLDQSINDLGCTRAFVMEGHNGKSNAHGLGFYYVDMTYERNFDPSYENSIYWQYKDMPTSIFPFFDYLNEFRYFYGTVDEMGKIDRRLATLIEAHGTHFMVAVEIPSFYNANDFVGILGYSFEGYPELSQTEIRDYMLEVRRRIQFLLSLKSLDGVDLNQFKTHIK